MKYALVAASLLALIMATGAQAQPPVTDSKLTKTATLEDFSFRYPDDWQIGKQGRMTTVAPNVEAASNDGTRHEERGINIVVMPLPPDAKPESVKPEEVLNMVFQQASQSSGSMERAGASVGIPVDGHAAAMLAYRDSSKKEAQEFGIMIVIRGDKNLAYFRMFCPAAEYQTGMSLFKSVTDSIKVIR